MSRYLKAPAWTGNGATLDRLSRIFGRSFVSLFRWRLALGKRGPAGWPGMDRSIGLRGLASKKSVRMMRRMRMSRQVVFCSICCP